LAYSRQQRASALRIVAEQGYKIAAGLTGISETSLRKWSAEAAERERKRMLINQSIGPRIGG
jgi:transposase-like protein